MLVKNHCKISGCEGKENEAYNGFGWPSSASAVAAAPYFITSLIHEIGVLCMVSAATHGGSNGPSAVAADLILLHPSYPT